MTTEHSDRSRNANKESGFIRILSLIISYLLYLSMCVRMTQNTAQTNYYRKQALLEVGKILLYLSVFVCVCVLWCAFLLTVILSRVVWFVFILVHTRRISKSKLVQQGIY